MGAEMDCCDSTDEGRRFYIELKTSREVLSVMDFHFVFSSLLFVSFDVLISFLPSAAGLSYRGKI